MAAIVVERGGRSALWRWAAALLALSTPCLARADGWTLRLEPGYSALKTATTAEGITTDTESNTILQKYGLTIDKTLWPLLRLTGGGVLDWNQGTLTTPTQEQDVDAKRWTGYAHLDMGQAGTRGGVGYDHREDSSSAEPRGAAGGPERVGSPFSSRLINDLYSAWALLQPEALPSAELRVSRSDTRDATGRLTDLQQDELVLNSKYTPIPELGLNYSFRGTSTDNRIASLQTLQLSNFVRGAYQDYFLERRLSFYASYDVNRLDSNATLSGQGGLVYTQQFPTRGFSVLEIFPATPERITLDQNPALVDANVSATAGIDIGYSRSVPSDNRPRHMGAQFADTVTPVNAVFVWVDRQLPADVATAYAAPGRWRAYQSDDNQVWTAVPVGPVVFGTFQNRFEITIAETRARYLKVVTAPLPAGVTFDPQFASVFVTELQTFQVQQAADVKGRRSSTTGSFNSATRYEFASVKGLSYDFTTFVRHGTQFATPPWSVMNGLSYLRRLGPTFLLSTHLDRSDSDEGRGHDANTRYALTLGATPLPTLTASAGVNGSYEQAAGTNELRNTVLASVTADLYRGVAATASGSGTYGKSDTGRSLRSLQASTTLSLVPHRVLSLSGTFAANDTLTQGGGTPETHTSDGRAEGSASFAPFPAFYLTGSVTRYLFGPHAPDTLANLGVTLSPLPGGPLLLRFIYQESLDTGQELRTRTIAPGLRWNIRPRWYLDVSYSRIDSTSPTVDTATRVFFASLFAVIGG